MVIFSLLETEENKIHLRRYKTFIESRPKRDLIKEEGFNIHHIVPRSLGGNNKKNNLIKLTIKEHYVAHLILWKCGYKEMITAFWIMAHKDKKLLTARQYESLKQNFSSYISKKFLGHKVSKETREKIREKNKKRLCMYNPKLKELISIKREDREKYEKKGYSSKRLDNSIRNTGKGNPMYGRDWREGKTKEEILQHHKKCGRKGKKNSMYGKSGYEKLDIIQYKKIMENKKKSMEIVWQIKRKMANENLKIRCKETKEVFDSFKDASNKVYNNNRKVKYIVDSILNNSIYRDYSWEFVNA